MRLGVAATPDVAIPTLDWLLHSDHEVALIITQPDKPAGRGRVLKQSVVADWADQHGISIIKPESPSDLRGALESLDCVITIGYGVLLPQEILDLPKHGFLNLHFSLLPAYRGAAPVQRALHNGDRVTGVSVFQLEKGMDTGPIYTQSSLDVEPSWRSFELLSALSKMGPAVIEQALKMITDGVPPIPQTGASSLAPKISKAEAQLDFSKPSEIIINSIRAFTYEPGSWSLWKGEPFKVTSAVSNYQTGIDEGAIVVLDHKVLVGCGHSSAIELLTVVPAGKREMSAIEWARGARLQGGEHFG
jgi:methionyl-tRNA formyltransferase